MGSHPLHPPRRTPKGHRPAVAHGAVVGDGDGEDAIAVEDACGGARRELVGGGSGGGGSARWDGWDGIVEPVESKNSRRP